MQIGKILSPHRSFQRTNGMVTELHNDEIKPRNRLLAAGYHLLQNDEANDNTRRHWPQRIPKLIFTLLTEGKIFFVGLIMALNLNDLVVNTKQQE